MNLGPGKFTRALRETGSYRTPANASWALLRLPGMPTIWFTILVVFQVVLGGLQVVIGIFSPERFVHRSYWLLWALEKAGATIDIKGARHMLDVEGAVVFVSNHMSALETVGLPCIIVPIKNCAFIVKESLATYPMFGRIIRQIQCITVSRTNPRADLEKVLNEGPRLLERGQSLVIFPQSTRTDTMIPAKFGTLGEKLARKGNVPVIPVAVKTDIWRPGKILKDFGPIDIKRPVHIEFGAPMTIQGTGKEEHQQIIAFIQDRLKSWGHPLAPE